MKKKSSGLEKELKKVIKEIYQPNNNKDDQIERNDKLEEIFRKNNQEESNSNIVKEPDNESEIEELKKSRKVVDKKLQVVNQKLYQSVCPNEIV